MEKVVLINPPSLASQERHYAKMPEPRLGLAYLAAYLETQGIAPRIIDARFEGLSLEQVAQRVEKEKPDLVGITALTPEIVDAAQLAEVIKRQLPHTPIVIGGAHATVLPVPTLEEFPAFDFLVYGEGEITLYELLQALRGEVLMETVKGLAFRHGSARQNEPRPLLTDLDRIPFPAWHLVPRAVQYPILSSRGCPFHCIFCNRILGEKLRLRSPQNIVDEMERVYSQYAPRRFSFNDDTFGINRRHTRELLNLIKTRGLSKKVKWNVTTRVDVVNLELLREMKEAGCTSVGFGIESGNPHILAAMGKGITLEQAEKAVAQAKKAGLRTNAFFILGHPYETRDTIRDTINFAARLNSWRINFGIMVPYPGTEVARLAERGEGNYRLLSHNWADYGKQVGNALELTTVSRSELEKWQLIGYLKFYFLHHFSLAKLWRLRRDVSPRAMIAYLGSLLRRRLALGKSNGIVNKTVP